MNFKEFLELNRLCEAAPKPDSNGFFITDENTHKIINYVKSNISEYKQLKDAFDEAPDSNDFINRVKKYGTDTLFASSEDGIFYIDIPKVKKFISTISDTKSVKEQQWRAYTEREAFINHLLSLKLDENEDYYLETAQILEKLVKVGLLSSDLKASNFDEKISSINSNDISFTKSGNEYSVRGIKRLIYLKVSPSDDSLILGVTLVGGRIKIKFGKIKEEIENRKKASKFVKNLPKMPQVAEETPIKKEFKRILNIYLKQK